MAIVVAAVVGIAVLTGGGWGDDEPAAAAASGEPSRGSPSGAVDRGTVDDVGSEVIRQPEGEATKGLPGLRKAKRPQTHSLVSAPLPRTATRRGTVVAGFPLSVIPVLTGSTVRSSGVSSTSGVLQVSIVARAPRSAGSVLGFYRRALSEHGFSESTVPAVGGSTASEFRRGADHLVITVSRPTSQGTTYSIFGDLHTSTND